MEYVKKVEVTMAGWFKQVPFHLPAGARKWLSENAWWLVLIGVVLSALSILASVRTYLWAEQVTNQYRDLALSYGVTPASTSALDMTAVWVSLVLFAAVVVLEVMAINPLKNQKKRGWDLLFMALLVSALSSVVSAVLSVSFAGLLGAAIGLAIGGYFLFEIHDRFTQVRTAKKSGTAPAGK